MKEKSLYVGKRAFPYKNQLTGVLQNSDRIIKMAKGALSRVQEHPNQGLKTKKVESKTILWCEPCHEQVGFQRSSVVQRHLGSEKHVKNKSK